MDSDSRSGTPRLAVTKTRTLTPSQRERKRAADRKAHRQSREKTKNYIAHLERLLDEAASADTSAAASNGTATSTDPSFTFLHRLKHDFNEIDRLKKSLATICEVAQTALVDASAIASTKTKKSTDPARPQLTSGPTTTSGSGPNDTVKSSTSQPLPGESNGEPLIELVSEDLSDNFASPASFSQFSGGLNSTSTDLTVLDMPFGTPKSDAAGNGWERNVHIALVDYHCSPRTIFALLGQFTCVALQSPTAATSPTMIAPDLVRDTDLIVRAVLHGWDVIAGDHCLDMSWQTLKQTDQQLLTIYHNRPAERLAILYVMRLQLHHILTGEYLPGTPNFLRARPSQKFINHPPHAAYYVWPGFREHLLVWPDRYSSDNLLQHLRSNFRFLWPYESQDLYVWDSFSGTYSFSADFSQRVEDIRCWTVQTNFFTLYPELRSEIPVFNERPSFIFPPCNTNFAFSLLTPAPGTMPELCSLEDTATSQSDSHASPWQLSLDSSATFRT
ncbi:hypothetical protein AJ78_05169 [Emergomyces pasteurianus Ep9510]|uniref:BZIP domain-containing protein n=1 Tax=Emergomyces pasteurianus Ep9510 TaxID=1447872 RepID=A0A1J9QH11_9EURO|nr:hypothetical protein AJ78_05169 [Emergomyces pasteurianus Ep9510]